MAIREEWKSLTIITGVFLVAFYLPTGNPRFISSIGEALDLVKWYAREHVVLCLLPAFLIAGAVGVFVGKASVMKYLGAGAKKFVSYAVASVSGSILAVCSCTILPLFAGIYRVGAGLGPATAFLYSGPAINVLAIVLTARVLGIELGVARAVGAVVFSIVIGLLMHLIFRKEEADRVTNQPAVMPDEQGRPLHQTAICFAAMIAILVFANWGKPDTTDGLWYLVYSYKWIITAISAILLAAILIVWYHLRWWMIGLAAIPAISLAIAFPGHPTLSFAAGVIGLSFVSILGKGETREWIDQSWGFAKQILPLLLAGVLVAGLLLGRPGSEGLIPSTWISSAVGGNSLFANLFASVVGAFMYFATLTEVPILEGLIGNGMGKGPALALLLAGPALSLPNMLVIRSVLGWKKTAVFVMLVIVMATISGIVFGAIVG